MSRGVLWANSGAERIQAEKAVMLATQRIPDPDDRGRAVLERNKPAERQTPEIVASNNRKTKEALDRLERDVAMLTERPHDIGHLSIGTALAYLDFRFQDDSWRDGRPNLAAWHATFLDRPAVRANPFAEDS